MTLIAIDDIEVDMVTAKPVMNQRGQVLLPAKMKLSEKHIQGLRTWAVKFVEVRQVGDVEQDDLSPEQLGLLEETVERCFSQNTEQLSHPILSFLKETNRNYLHILFQTPGFSLESIDIPEPESAYRVDTILHLINHGATLTTLPEIRRKLVMVINSPDTSIGELSEIISLDPGLSALVIKMSKSAWYGVNHRMNTVASAASIIGFEDLRSFVNEISEMSAYSTDETLCATPYSFWLHSVATSVISRLVAEEIGYGEIEHVSLVALLHDLGKHLLYTEMPLQYGKICRYAWQTGTPTLKFERKYLGFYHNLVSMELLKHWNYSKSFQDTVYFHHAPENATVRTEAYIVHFADALANAMGYSVQRFAVLPTIEVKGMSEIGLNTRRLSDIATLAKRRMLDIKHELQIP